MQKHLLLIEANTTGTGMLAIQKAQQLGYSPLFFTNNPQRYRGLEQFACPVIVCDTNSVEPIAQAIAQRLRPEEIAGITTTSEFYLEMVARLAELYHLPANTPRSIQVCRNKGENRQLLEKAGIGQPKYAIVRSQQEVDAAVRHVGFPCVVKPVDDTGSYEVLLCRNRREASGQVEHILEILTNFRGQLTARTVLIEEFLDAPEVSVEMFTWHGKTTCIGITEKTITGAPYFVECRHIFPANLPASLQQEIEGTVRLTLEAAGITHGAAHTEVKLTQQGCAIIEVNARPAGGMIPALVSYVTGIDIVEQQLRISFGESPDLSSHSTGYAGIQFLVADKAGTWLGIQGIEEASQLEGVEQVEITKAAPGRVFSPRSAYDRLGYVIARGTSYDQVADRLQRAINLLHPDILRDAIEEK